MAIALESTPAGALLLTVTQAAELLGISRSAAYQLVGAGELPLVRLGARSIRIHRGQLEELIAVKARESLANSGLIPEVHRDAPSRKNRLHAVNVKAESLPAHPRIEDANEQPKNRHD